MDLKRIKAAISEMQACVEEMEGGEEKPAMPSDDDEDESPKGSADTLKMKLMKYKS
jgi:hypothetical protein